MSDSDDHFVRFEGHTLLKHRILRAYLSAWAFKLLQGRNEQVYFIDAFAGEGRDHEGNPGSPLIAAKIASEVAGKIAPEHPRQRLFVFAIENLAKRHDRLKACLTPFGPDHPGHVEVRLGELPAFIDEIVAKARDAAALYFLDPFGIKGLDATTYPKALRGPQNEIFALFADMGASRLYGLVTAESFDLEERLRSIRDVPSLFPEMGQAEEEVVTRDALEHQRALDYSQGPSRHHLTTALGGDHWMAELEGQPPHKRGAIFLALFIQKLFQSGARFVLSLPMRNEQGARIYSLVYATKSEAGLLAMKDAVSSGLNRGLLPQEVVDRIREDLTAPIEDIVQLLGLKFAGRAVSWSQEVRRAILTMTPAFNFQTDAIQARLNELGRIDLAPSGKIARPIVCRFPPK